METIETIIPDTKGNHLVVVLTFYDNSYKENTLLVSSDIYDIDIADISIEKLDLDKPLHFSALYSLSSWLLDQFAMFPNAVFTFICSTDPLNTNHTNIFPEEYRWRLFNRLSERCLKDISRNNIQIKDFIVGPDGYQSYARVYFRERHKQVVQFVSQQLEVKYH